MSLYRHHIFVCLNTREASDPRGCCSAKGSEAVLEAFKAEVVSRGMKGTVRANRAGCLDQCSHGPVVVIYPEGVWYVGVKPTDVPEIVAAMVKGLKVERLLHPRSR